MAGRKFMEDILSCYVYYNNDTMQEFFLLFFDFFIENHNPFSDPI